MIWEPFIGPYEVSDHGQIRHSKTGKIRKSKRLPPSGYKQVTLFVDRKFVYVYLHRAVLETFVGRCPEGMQARHLNGDNSDNRLCNLAWGTPLENSDDKRRHGTMARGFRLPHTKLSPEQRSEIRIASGRQIDIANRYGVSRSLVQKIRGGVAL